MFLDAISIFLESFVTHRDFLVFAIAVSVFCFAIVFIRQVLDRV